MVLGDFVPSPDQKSKLDTSAGFAHELSLIVKFKNLDYLISIF